MQYRKMIATLTEETTLSDIEKGVDRGMRVALIDAALPIEVQNALKEKVLNVFKDKNTPIGIMLRVRENSARAERVACDYLLFEEDTKQSRESGHQSFETFLREELSKVPMVKGPTCFIKLSKPMTSVPKQIQGVCTNDSSVAKWAREKQLMMITEMPSIPSDALWFNTINDLIHAEHAQERQEDKGERSANADILNETIKMASHLAEAIKADAIMVFTTNGLYLSAVSSLYHQRPIIVVAKRPMGEAVLLKQTIRWGTLPTAITQVPESVDAIDGFTRMVGKLYGYQTGDTIVATGHWLEAGNPNQIHCVVI